MRNPRAQQGFTLIELVFAMLIMGLITKVALPQISAVFRVNMRTGATRVASYFHSAYDHAVMRHERIRVSFNPENGKFWAETYKEPESTPLWNEETKIEDAMMAFEKKEEDELAKGAAPGTYQKIDSDSLRSDSLPQGVRVKSIYMLGEKKLMTDATPYIEFLPSGFSSSAIIYLTNDSNDVYSIILYPIGGKVKIEKGETSPEEV